MANFIFQEAQRFRQIWIWGILITVTGVAIGSILFTSPTGLEWEHAIPVGIIGVVILLLFNLELKTRIDHSRLTFSYSPFIRERHYRFEEIVSLELIEYNGFWEYGGWGIKWNGDMWSYTTGGKYGLLVKTTDKKFLLGTQNPKDAQKAIELFEEYKSNTYGS